MKGSKRKSIKWQSLTELFTVLFIVILLNLILSNIFFRFDLTSEKKYSLSNSSKELAQKIEGQMYIKVYLEGEFPAGFKRLSKSVKEMLDEFRAYAGNKIDYEFVDPFKDANDKQSNDIVVELNSKGLLPTNIQIKKEDEFAQKIIIPGAIVFYNGKEYPVNFLRGQFGQAPEETINSSIELIEYEIASVLRKATAVKEKKIAIIEDHGELSRWQLADAIAQLQEFYTVERLPLSIQVPEKLHEYAGVIVAKPTQPFSDFDKFKLDQYIMHGGKVLWLVETQLADMDSLRASNLFVTISYPTQIEDMFYRYGFRVNQNILQDLQCNAIPVLSGMRDGVPQQKLLPWPYFPVVTAASNHPVVKGVEPVWMQFANSIDTFSNTEIKKTVLLQSSDYSRVIASPARVDLNVSRLDLQPEMFRSGKGNFITALLLEGKFKSNFRFKFDKAVDSNVTFVPEVANNKMIVISDGDVIANQVKQSSGEVFPLGYDRYTQQQFGNKKFILNCIDYLCDDSGILEVRSKEVTLRLLDKGKIKKHKQLYILLNIGLPLLMVLIFGLINHWVRLKKYRV